MGTLERKWGPFGDPKTEKGPHGDPGPQMGTHVRAVQKKSTCVEAENIFKDSLHTNIVLDEIPEHTGERAAALKHQFDYNVRDSVKATLTAVNRHKWEEHEKGLVVQGNFLALAT